MQGVISLGLSSQEAQEKLKEHGPNVLGTKKKKSFWKILLAQFSSPIILMLVVIAVASFILNKLSSDSSGDSNIDTILILIIVLISGFAGFIQDYKAEKSVEALQDMLSLKAKVYRDKSLQEIPVEELVPGDLIILEGGDVIPADAKLIEAINLEIDESSLTGESEAIKKDQNQEIFMNTMVNAGKAQALVVQTGLKTQMGKLAKDLQEDEATNQHFQNELKNLTQKIIIFTVFIIVAMFAIGFFKYGLYKSFMLAISLAVAAIPEGLPAIVTLTLALGAKRMSKQNALVRKMSVIETLGSVNIICTDKTGTLTENNMQVRKIYFNGQVFDADNLSSKELEPIIKCGVICNNSSFINEAGTRKLIGNQTEIALRKIGEKLNIDREELFKQINIEKEVPFDSSRKKMSVLTSDRGEYTVYSKGASEILLEDCKYIYQDGKRIELTKELKNKVKEANKAFANQALRVIGLAYKEVDNSNLSDQEIESDLVWLGSQAMMDPPRQEIKEAIRDCKSAGVRVIMITGDNPDTARAIAAQIGIETQGVLCGSDLYEMDEKDLEAKLNNGFNIFARTSPFHKQKILQILQKDNVVAMTGDGVNDSLAIKAADVGIAMGIRGTEVSKQVSDIILLDDNFSTITVAIKEGRAIFDNIRKFINYLFTCNLAEVGVIFLATIIINPTNPVLLPIHILWINLLTDGLPALALGIDPAKPGIMQEKPRKKGAQILDEKLIYTICSIGFTKTLILLLTFVMVLPHGFGYSRACLLTGFVLYEFIRIAVIRHQEGLNFFANKWLTLALFVSLSLQLVIVYSPLNKFFHLEPIGVYGWSVLLVGTVVGYISAIFIAKAIDRMMESKNDTPPKSSW